MARRNPGEILFTTAGPNIRPNGRKRRKAPTKLAARRNGIKLRAGETDFIHAAARVITDAHLTHNGLRVYAVADYGPGRAVLYTTHRTGRLYAPERGEAMIGSLTMNGPAMDLRVPSENLHDGIVDALDAAGAFDPRRNGRNNTPRKNGAATTADPVAARELELYIENEAALVGPGNTLGQAIMRNLAGKILRGTYDRTKAWKAWSPLVDEGAKRYTREFGEGKGYGAFNAATRRMVAVELAEVFEREIEAGGLDAAELAGVKSNPRKRKNSMGADAMYYALQQKRIPWSKMTRAQIEAVMQDAAQHGDTKLAQRARAALARR